MNSPLAALKSKGSLKMRLLTGFGVVLLVIAIIAGVHYLLVGQFRESTDDAYLQADNVIISPQVAGTVTDLYVTDNQLVKAGDVLAKLDERSYKAKLDQSEADVASAQADLDNADAQLARQHAAIVQSQAQVISAQAQAQFAVSDAARYAQLVEQGAASQQLVQKSRTQSKSSGAAVAETQAALETARKQLDVLQAEREKAAANLAHAQALLEQNKINDSDTIITAPIDGVVGDRSVRQGQFVSIGTGLMTIVPLKSIYLIANYKETQVARMTPGDEVDVEIDSFPDGVFHGKIESVAPGTGAQFALLPPENATGNFTKIVQRVPVKIAFDHDNKQLDKLRPGLSATAIVHTGGTHEKPAASTKPDDKNP